MIYFFFFQFWSAYVPCGAAQLNAVQLSLEQIDVIRRLAEMNAQHLTLVTSVKGKYTHGVYSQQKKQNLITIFNTVKLKFKLKLKFNNYI